MESAHVSALAQKHAGLDAQLEAERQRPSPDQLRIAELKKKKLHIKQELAAVG